MGEDRMGKDRMGFSLLTGAVCWEIGCVSDNPEGGSGEGIGLRIKLASQAVATPIQVQAMRYDGM